MYANECIQTHNEFEKYCNAIGQNIISTTYSNYNNQSRTIYVTWK